MSSPQERSAHSFVERHGLWSDEQFEAAAKADKSIEEHGLEVVRLSFPDQHGILRGKPVMAGEAAAVMRNGCCMTTTLLAKDTAHKTAFPVFTPGGGFGMPEMEGAADFLMIADPTTFHVLPWAPQTGWVLCDIYFASGKPVPFATRHLYRCALQTAGRGRVRLPGRARGRIPRLQARGRAARARRRDLAGRAARGQPDLPGLPVPDRDAPRPDGADPRNAAPPDRRARPAAALGRDRARSQPVRVHLPAAARAFARRHHDAVPQRGEADLPAAGLSRELHGGPKLANVLASGWHLHQSLRDRRLDGNAFAPTTRSRCRPRGAVSWPASSRMRARRRPSPRRRSTATALPRLLAGAGPRDLGPRQSRRDDPRAGRRRRRRDAAREPGRRAGRQPLPLHGLADRDRARRDGAHARSRSVGRHPLRGAGAAVAEDLDEALRALRDDACLADGFGRTFIDYYLRIKEAEIARYNAEVTEWEQREYFELF